jgi:putative hydrolase of the HAD superfamily
MQNDIAAAAFDVDGTLYPNRRFYLRAVPQALSHPRLLAAFSTARARIRRSDRAPGGFRDLQARLCAEELGAPEADTEKVKALIEKHIYGAWERLFTGINPFPWVRECLRAFKERGLKLAVLSDFPLGSKLAVLGLAGIWDAELCSEETGALKPHPAPFLRLAECLGLAPKSILYVGNSPAYDIAGAQNAGMKAALINSGCHAFPRRSHKSYPAFRDYRQLREYVLG